MDSGEWLDKYLEALADTALRASDACTCAGFDPVRFRPLYGKQWLDRLWTARETAQQKQITANELAKGFLGPGIIRYELYFLQLMAKSCSNDKEKTMKILNWLNDILCAKASEDPYGFNSTKIHVQSQVKEMTTLLPFHSTSEEEAKEIGKLANACRELTRSLYGDFFAQWFETFGPYSVGEDKELLLYAFTNFEPAELWQDYAGFHPNNVYIYAVYENAQIKLDQWSHPTSNGSLPQKMKKAFILAHTKIIEKPEELHALREKMEAAAVAQGKRVQQMDFEQQKQWLLNSHCYSFRDFFKILGLDWRPAEEMINSVKGKPLLNADYPKFETLEEKKQFWKKLFDPRDEFFLEGLKIS